MSDTTRAAYTVLATVAWLATLWFAWLAGRWQEADLTDRALEQAYRAEALAEQCAESHQLRNSYLAPLRSEEEDR